MNINDQTGFCILKLSDVNIVTLGFSDVIVVTVKL